MTLRLMVLGLSSFQGLVNVKMLSLKKVCLIWPVVHCEKVRPFTSVACIVLPPMGTPAVIEPWHFFASLSPYLPPLQYSQACLAFDYSTYSVVRMILQLIWIGSTS